MEQMEFLVTRYTRSGTQSGPQAGSHLSCRFDSSPVPRSRTGAQSPFVLTRRVP